MKTIVIAPLMIFPLISWWYFICNYKKKQAELKEYMENHNKANCVVMYCKNLGMKGWPNYENRIVPHLSNMNILFEPFLHFIDNSTKTIDIAMMLLNVNIISHALIKAHDRGVKIRIALNISRKENLIELSRAGEVRHFTPDVNTVDSIMHYKYIIRDHSERNQALLCGSMNMTMQGFFNNFEDIVITTNETIVETLHENFEFLWTFLHH